MSATAAVNITGKENVTELLQKIVGKFDALPAIVGKAAGAFAAFEVAKNMLQGLVRASEDTVTAFAEQERALVGWAAALETSHQIAQSAVNSLADFANEMGKLTGADDEAILGMEAFLATSGRTADEIEKVISAAASMAVVTGDDLAGAVEKLNATYAGSVRGLERFIPALGDFTKEQLENGAAIGIIAKQYDGLAEAMGDTLDVSLKNLKNSYDDLMASFGRSAEPVFKPIVNWLSTIISKWAEANDTMSKYRKAEETYSEFRTKQQQLEILNGERLIQQRKIDAAYEATRMLENQLKLTGGGMSPFAYSQALLGIQTESAPAKERIAGEKEAERLRLEIEKLTKELSAIRGGGNTEGGEGKSSLQKPQSALFGFGPVGLWGSGFDPAGIFRGLMGSVAPDAIEDPHRVKNYRNRQSSYSRSDQENAFFSQPETIIGQAKENPFMDALTSLGNAIAPLVGGFGGIFSSLSSVKSILDPLGLMLEGIFKVLQPAIDGILTPVINFFGSLGEQIGTALLPVFEFLAEIILPFVMDGLKHLAVALEIVLSPLRFLGDMLSWVGKVLSDFAFNITHWGQNQNTAGEFSSDAFSGLEARLAAIVTSDYSKGSLGGNSYVPAATSGVNASYQQQRDITVNNYIYTPALVGEGGFDEFCIMVTRRIQNLGLLGRT